jgi:hypothetical protein
VIPQQTKPCKSGQANGVICKSAERARGPRQKGCTAQLHRVL